MTEQRKYDIYLNIYDFVTNNSLLSCLGLPIYHTGVEIKYSSELFSEIEFCYCVTSSDEQMTGVIMI